MKDITVREWIEKFNNGEFESNDFETQCNAGWYDWFCKESSLANKTIRMGNIIKKITNPTILDTMYVFFKNNCPMVGGLYDQFKFCDLETGDVIYCISCDDSRSKYRYEVYGIANDFKEEIAGFNSSRELVKWFNGLAAKKTNKYDYKNNE